MVSFELKSAFRTKTVPNWSNRKEHVFRVPCQQQDIFATAYSPKVHNREKEENDCRARPGEESDFWTWHHTHEFTAAMTAGTRHPVTIPTGDRAGLMRPHA